MNLESAFNKALFTVVRIRTISESGTTSHGSAFVYEYVTEDNTFPFLVSAQALVADAREGRLALLQGEGKEPRLGKGYTLDIDQFSKLWYSHPDSQLGVAITPFVPFVRHVENTGIRVHFNAFVDADIASDEYFNSAEFGSSCFSMGFPAGYWDKKNLLAVVKQSRFASLPAIDYGVRHQRLLDTPCHSGWLGAPVVAKENNTIKLLGMLSSASQVFTGETDEQDLSTADDASMTAMLKVDAVIETIKAYLKEKGFI